MRVRHRALLCLGLLIALLVAPPASAKKGKKQFTVAVMAFQNASGDKEHESLGLGFQSMMTTDLAQVEAFELVERARLNDVLEEHKLAKSRLTDKKKVVKLGKLVGATHLLGGSFIIQGDKMRVDARLVSAQTGRVVLAEKVEGLKDAFFELEKKLVDQVIRALGAKLSAKERAKVARVHTVEFKAFKAFSQGVRHFDNKRYESALKALKRASQLDDEFRLARLTKSEYERVISRLRERARSIRLAEADVKQLAKDKEQTQLESARAWLHRVASRQGKAHAIDRATALYILARTGTGTARVDRFVKRRAKESIRRRYLNDAIGLFPKLPLDTVGEIVSGHPGAGVFEWDKDLDAQFAKLRRGLLKQSIPARGIFHLPRTELMHMVLAIPQRKEVEFFASVWPLIVKHAPTLGPDPPVKLRHWAKTRFRTMKGMARIYRSALEFDKSSALFSVLSSGVKDPDLLDFFAEEIALNRDMKSTLAKAKNKALMGEFLRAQTGDCKYLYNRINSYWKTNAKRFLSDPTRSNSGLLALRRVRGGFCKLMFMGDHALWAVGMRGTLASGPETRSDETTELRYYWRPQPKEYETLVIVDGTFRSDLRASFTASFKHPRDWIPDELWARRLKDDEPPAIEDARLIRDRPYVGFFLGGRDVRRPYLNLSEAEKKAGARNRPFTGLMVQIAGDVIRLAQIRGKGATPRDRIRHFETKVLKEHRLKASGQKLKVGVKVQPKKSVVIVTVNGTPYRFKTDALRPGLYGFHLSKAGYVGIRDLKVR